MQDQRLLIQNMTNNTLVRAKVMIKILSRIWRQVDRCLVKDRVHALTLANK